MTMIATEEVVVKKKLKIKFGTKKVEAEPRTQSCEPVKQLSQVKDRSSLRDNSTSGISILPNPLARRVYSDDQPKVKSFTPSAMKRGPQWIIECQKEKRQKIDRSLIQQCSIILKKLMTHPAGWVFNQPVDPGALNIPDYFSIITNPMDLGTIKSRLEKDYYCTGKDFAADVRLTFSNAMLYNPPANNVHLMAKKLNGIFNKRWKIFESKWEHGGSKVKADNKPSLKEVKKNSDKGQSERKQINYEGHPVHSTSLTKRTLSPVEKKKIMKDLMEIAHKKMPLKLLEFLRKCGLYNQNGDTTEMNVDAIDVETFWKLRMILKSCLDARAAEVKLDKMTKCEHYSVKSSHKGTGNGGRRACGSVSKLPLSSVSCLCGSSGSIGCQYSRHDGSSNTSSSDLSIERSITREHCRDAPNLVAKTPTLHISQLDLGHGGAISIDEDENSCLRQPLGAPDIADREGWKASLDVHLSPKRALRAKMLKNRFADTILRAQQKTLLNHGDKANSVKLQQEKEKMERKWLEENSRIQTQVQAEIELKTLQEKERQAARIALQKIEKTVEIDDNLRNLKELMILCGYSVNGSFTFTPGCSGNLLESLGLFMKDDYLCLNGEDEEGIPIGDGEEGEIVA